jgi:hypothetical protein
MKYEAPAVVVLTPAIDAIQDSKNGVIGDGPLDASAAYEDWE